MRKDVYLLLMALSLFLACKSTVQNVDLKKPIDAQILSLKNNDKSDSLKLDLCSFIPIKWDSLVVVTGYALPKSLEAFNFENHYVLGQLIGYSGMPENSILLLYIQGKRIVGYSELPSPQLHYLLVSKHYMSGFTVIYESECDNLWLRKEGL
ncbi:hypothetical protein [Pedobacter aquatilis]|uniref:hypothetical protein n=1 Tax=Pedobacter aquatilis TaxID=351343 RepID=UPI00292E91DD|nr:hypothetical protein [Pedobacter aquatilis]